jgi:16S rRNA processing protein RimM
MSRPFDPETLLMGVMGRPHGLHGEMFLRPYGGASDLGALSVLLLEQNGARREWGLRQARRVADGWLVRLQGVESRTDAEALTNATVWVPRRALPPLGPGEFYVEDLVGCRVETESGAVLGVVQGIFWNGAQDVITIAGVGDGQGLPNGQDDQVMIPVVPNFVRLVDPEARRVVVAWEGPE